MSKITEMAEREAAAAESEPEPTEPSEPSEPEPSEPEPEPAPNAADLQAAEDAQVKALRRHMEQHGRKLRSILGDVFDAFEPCTYCEGIGYREQGAPVHHPLAEQCPDCGGHGFRFTGAVNPSYATLACESCQGQGYRLKPPPMSQPPVASPTLVYIDPSTGLQVPAPGGAASLPANGAWAPGYTPQPQPVPVPVPQP